MPVDIRDHPDAPSLDALGELVVEPVSRAEIQSHRESGDRLLECNLNEHESFDAYAELETDPFGEGANDDVGTALYRLVQLFGTPQLAEYAAGEDVSDRTDTTFKYLFRVRAPGGTDLPDEWLVTAFDWHVRLGVALADWGASDADEPAYRPDVALTSFALVANVASEPVQCEYEDVWY